MRPLVRGRSQGVALSGPPDAAAPTDAYESHLATASGRVGSYHNSPGLLLNKQIQLPWVSVEKAKGPKL